ncbi:fluoride efflux transporter FluC [Leifsonia xyli]|uniref:fluoride efflux transporter FluC n=1 Tax=Leifsonia xyli TaxID=1575 RepID=UPI0005C7A503|nr:CrcB family protein [Leifsonia xyli]
MSTRSPLPVYLHGRSVLLVFVGGALGTAVRALLSAAAPTVAGIPVITFAINIVGAFVLGWLLESLALRGPDEGRRRDARLFAGTGILGGFTTYSAFAVDIDGLVVASNVGGGILYAAATIAIGAAASLAGIPLGAAIGRRRGARA